MTFRAGLRSVGLRTNGLELIVWLSCVLDDCDTSTTPFRGSIPYDFAFFDGFDLTKLLRATACRTSALKADASTSSPSWMSIARRTLPSRLELKRRAGSFSDAPLAKVSFTTFL